MVLEDADGRRVTVDYRRAADQLTRAAAANATVAEACAAAWDVLDDLAYGDWSLIDQAAARAAIVAVIEASDARDSTLNEDDAPRRQPA
jgi:hypothetical protein